MKRTWVGGIVLAIVVIGAAPAHAVDDGAIVFDRGEPTLNLRTSR